MAKRTKKQHLKTEHLLVIVAWLEHAPNFEQCFGVAKKTSVGKQSTKTAGFKAMAEALEKSTKFVLGPKRMREHYTTFKNRYMRAKAYEDSTGAGVSAEDEANGIYTMQQKMESLRPCYDRMNKPFGEKANFEPLDAYDSTARVAGAAQPETAIGANEEDEEAYSSLADDGEVDEEAESGEEVLNNPSEMLRDGDDMSTPRSPSFAFSDTLIEDLSGIPLTQLTPASPLARATQHSLRTETTATSGLPATTPVTPATQHAQQPDHTDTITLSASSLASAAQYSHQNAHATTQATLAATRTAQTPPDNSVNLQAPTLSNGAMTTNPTNPDRDSQQDQRPMRNAGNSQQVPRMEATTRRTTEEVARGQASRGTQTERPASESRLSKKPRKTNQASLNSSPRSTSGSGSRIAKAMAMAAESKANVERHRLAFDKEKWTSEAEQRSVAQQLERERFAFEMAKWENERDDRRSAMQQQQRFQILSSLIEKGHSVDEAKEFLTLL